MFVRIIHSSDSSISKNLPLFLLMLLLHLRCLGSLSLSLHSSLFLLVPLNHSSVSTDCWTHHLHRTISHSLSISTECFHSVQAAQNPYVWYVLTAGQTGSLYYFFPEFSWILLFIFSCKLWNNTCFGIRLLSFENKFFQHLYCDLQ